ncbi:MAG: ABC transporter ATP-binding protein [Actinobacteria bacterium]|nr:ABC transporter ATP-binding protein [Actinomycetota bacterium]MCI0544466.1 ABC transporter ATP-binding protein [Actinomycetota bacterium]
MIRWDDVAVAYSGVAVLGPVDLLVGDGEWVGLIGPNGAGKSTLLRTAVGLAPNTGTVTARNGRPRPGPDVAWLPQRPSLPEGMGVADYVMLGRSPHIGYLGRESRHDREAVKSALTALGLEQLARRPLGTLSGGEVQRVVLARALAQQAPVLLLDEPTAGLDLGHAIEVMEVIDRLRVENRLTVVTAIHDMTLAGRFCPRLVLLGGGLVRADGTPSQVLTETTLRSHYGERVKVIHDGLGPTVVPDRRQP